MPKPTKLDMKLHLRNMINERQLDYKVDELRLTETALDIACLTRCLALVEATMPEQMADEESLQES